MTRRTHSSILLQRCAALLGVVMTGLFGGGAARADTTVRVSVKVVNGTDGRASFGYYHTDAQIRGAFAEANTALAGMGANWDLDVVEIVDAVVPQWFQMSCDSLPAMESAAYADTAAYGWRDDAINMYVVNVDQECGGACSFPNGITGTQEIIVINNLGIANDGIGWLHEIGHYFGLWHSFQCMTPGGQPCAEHDLEQCTGAGSLDRRCDDTCPDLHNVMSYHPGIDEATARFSPCQLDAIAAEMAGRRRHVVSSAVGSPADPEPPVAPVVVADDDYENNDRAETAARIGTGSFSLQGLDEDWFRIAVEAGTTDVRVTAAAGDLDLFLIDAVTGQELGRSEGPDSNEQLRVSTSGGDLLIAVAPYQGSTTAYLLEVAAPTQPTPTPGVGGGDDAYEDNDGSEEAVVLEAGRYALQGLDADWFRVAAVPGSLSVQISGAAGDLDLALYDGRSGLALAVSESERSNETVHAQVGSGDYYIAVTPYQGQTSSYTMNIVLLPSTIEGGEPRGIDGQDPAPAPVGACGAGLPMLLGVGALGLVRGRRAVRSEHFRQR